MILIHMQDGRVSAVTTDDGDLAHHEIVVLDDRPWLLKANLEEDISRAVGLLRTARENTVDDLLQSALSFMIDKARELSTKERSEIIDGLVETCEILAQARSMALNIEKKRTATSPTGITLSA